MNARARPLLPEPHRASLLRSMHEAAPRCYAQVATLGCAAGRAAPKVRTITLHHVADLDELAFSTSTLSAKWSELCAHPRVAGVLFDVGRFVQFRWEGPVELADVDSPIHGDLLRRMWSRLSPSVRTFTWDDYARSAPDLAAPFDADQPCPAEGLVLCRPDRWDVLRFDVEDYGRSSRSVLTWSGSAWRERVAPLQRSIDD